MGAFDGPSPSPSTMPPPPGGSKRPRTSNVAATAPGPSRAKRRKPDHNQDVDGGKQANGNAGKGKDDDSTGEAIEYVHRVDFNNLPVETLYKYLRAHDLLPRFEPSPWSEDPCIPPNALYTIPPASISVPAEESPTKERPNSPTPPKPVTAEAGVYGVEPGVTVVEAPNADTTEVPNDTTEGQTEAGGDAEDENMDEEPPAPPTTRSKTLPWRKAPTPTPPPRSASPTEMKRGVVTLSDVEAARAVLSEKANAHWGRGLGGGQNREGETIVNFLYKLKAGPTRLLRVYNPWPAT